MSNVTGIHIDRHFEAVEDRDLEMDKALALLHRVADEVKSLHAKIKGLDDELRSIGENAPAALVLDFKMSIATFQRKYKQYQELDAIVKKLISDQDQALRVILN